MGSRASIVEALRSNLTRLCDNPDEIDRKSPAALRRAHEQFTWDAKARMTLEIYRWVVGERPGKPDFGLPFPDPL